jgi:hypothetical protein
MLKKNRGQKLFWIFMEEVQKKALKHPFPLVKRPFLFFFFFLFFFSFLFLLLSLFLSVNKILRKIKVKIKIGLKKYFGFLWRKCNKSSEAPFPRTERAIRSVP